MEDVVARVIRDFFTTTDDELSINKGDIVQVLKKLDKYWCYVLASDKRGNVPCNCLIAVETPTIEDGQELFVARANINSGQAGDLLFSKGDLIVGLQKVDTNWWQGMIDDRIGIFPVNYVWQMDSAHIKVKGKQLSLQARVKMNMKAKLEDEMDLFQGEIVFVTQIIDKNWYRGVCGNRSGTFPAAYVEILSGANNESVETDAASALPDPPVYNANTHPDTPPLISFSPEKEVKSSTEATDDLKDVFTDDYFRRNMPTMFQGDPVKPSAMEDKLDDTRSSLAGSATEQSLLDLDIVPYGISLYPFCDQFENELGFNEGEVVMLIRHIDQFWMEGTIDGKKGIFPTNYITIVVDCAEQPTTVCDPEHLVFPPDSFAVVLYNFDAQMKCDLSVEKDQVVHVLAQENSDWCRVKDHAGREGYCPCNHLAPHCRQMAGDRNSLAVLDPPPTAEPPSGKLQRSFSVSTAAPPRPVGGGAERKVSLDRLPHRPAPPAPVPGHKPVQRTAVTRQRAANRCSPVAEERGAAAAACEDRGPESSDLAECRKKKSEHRQNVISELVFTEKEYVHNLKITYETFNLYNPHVLEARGIDVKAVFGNLLEVVQEAENLLDAMLLAMKGKSEDQQLIGPCFMQMADRLRCVYGQYCMNHDHALTLLEKYENIPEVQNIFEKGLETLRHQIACFNMGSILIKPVQRILKYPLILNELIKCTDQSHPDYPILLSAVQAMTQVATYINECKRRKDIVNKYLEDGTATISSKMSRLSLHSVAKKSSRLGVLLTSTLGFGNITKDPAYDELEGMFQTVLKVVGGFAHNVAALMACLHEEVLMELDIAEGVAHFCHQDADALAQQFHAIQRVVNNNFWPHFRLMVTNRVEVPLITLLELCQGPSLLAQKRHDKLLDYVGCLAKADKNKDNKLIQEELSEAKNNYEALHNHLLEELPQLTQLATELFIDCLGAFITARKLLSGKITKQYITLMEKPSMQFSQGDLTESFAVRHNLVLNQFARFSFSSKPSVLETLAKRSSVSPTRPPQRASLSASQSAGQRAYLQSRYSPDMLYRAVQGVTATEALRMSVAKGHLVAVIKKQDPMGDPSMWFVDDGATQGFLPSRCLESAYSQNSTPISAAGQSTDKMGAAGISKMGATGTSQIRTRGTDHIDASGTGQMGASGTNTKGARSAGQIGARSTGQIGAHSTGQIEAHSTGQIGTRSTGQIGASGTSQIRTSGTNAAASVLPPSYEEVVNHYSELAENHLYAEIPDETASPVPEFYYAMYDFNGDSGQHALTIRTGQVVSAIHKQDLQGNSEWWFVEDRFGAQGYVPANYLSKYK